MSEHCLIKKNTPELRKKLEDAGLSVLHLRMLIGLVAGVLICHMMYMVCIRMTWTICLKKPIWRCISRKRIRLYVNRMMSLLTCVNKLKGNDYAVDYLQATIR